MKRIIFYFALILLIGSCNHKNDKTAIQESDKFTYAKYITTEKHNGYTTVKIANPWKPGSYLQTYNLVPADSAIPDNISKGTLIRVPLKQSLVYSSVHSGVIKELTGSYNGIKGVCDAEYFDDAEIRKLIEEGKIANCGSSMSPSIEQIIEAEPDAILLSPFQNAGYGQLTTLGTPIIECADYMENTPLGRAEWIKFFGMLYGKENKADSTFELTKTNYLNLIKLTDTIATRPKVITENVINGVWYVPGGNSYMGNLIKDAGANYPWSDNADTGSLQLDFNQVYDKAHDAKFWLIKSFKDETLSSIKQAYALNSKMDAFNNNGIYFCNTSINTLFTDFPFHPDLLLKEYIKIFHKELLPDYQLKYFKPIIK